MEPRPRGKPVTVHIVLDADIDEATLRALALCEHSTMRREAKLLLSDALARVRANSPEITAAAQLLVDAWHQAAIGVSSHEAKGGLRVVD